MRIFLLIISLFLLNTEYVYSQGNTTTGGNEDKIEPVGPSLDVDENFCLDWIDRRDKAVSKLCTKKYKVKIKGKKEERSYTCDNTLFIKYIDQTLDNLKKGKSSLKESLGALSKLGEAPVIEYCPCEDHSVWAKVYDVFTDPELSKYPCEGILDQKHLDKIKDIMQRL